MAVFLLSAALSPGGFFRAKLRYHVGNFSIGGNCRLGNCLPFWSFDRNAQSEISQYLCLGHRLIVCSFIEQLPSLSFGNRTSRLFLFCLQNSIPAQGFINKLAPHRPYSKLQDAYSTTEIVKRQKTNFNSRTDWQ